MELQPPVIEAQLNTFDKTKYILVLNTEVSQQRLEEVFAKLTALPIEPYDAEVFLTGAQIKKMKTEKRKRKSDRAYIPTFSWGVFDVEQVGFISMNTFHSFKLPYFKELPDPTKGYSFNLQNVLDIKRHENITKQRPVDYL